MSQVISFSDAVGVAGLVVSIVGIPLTYILARGSRRRPEIRYLREIESAVEAEDRLFEYGLVMSFKGRPIKSVRRTYVALWNHKGDTIRGADIIPADPLRIQVGPKETVLQVRLLARSRPHTKIEACVPEHDRTCARLSFDFLDASDGAVFEVIHEGTDIPEVVGTVRGASLVARGEAELTPATLKNLARPFWGRLSAFNLRFPVAPFFLCVVTGLALLYFSPVVRVKRSLVDPAKYDLTTTNGQSSFANAVVGQADGMWPILAVFACFCGFSALATIWGLYSRSRRAFPRRIVNELHVRDSDILAGDFRDLPHELIGEDGSHRGEEPREVAVGGGDPLVT